MEQPKLGQLLDDSAGRDAIHIAIAPLVAAEKLYPGQDVGADGTTKSPIGIVDPFLKAPVFPGQKFYGFLYPNTITSLRHVWVHPAFEAQAASLPSISELPDKAAAKAWLENYARTVGLDYYEIISAAESFVKHSEFLCDGARWEGEYVPDEFWDHYETATGATVAKNDRGSFFSCSC